MKCNKGNQEQKNCTNFNNSLNASGLCGNQLMGNCLFVNPLQEINDAGRKGAIAGTDLKEKHNKMVDIDQIASEALKHLNDSLNGGE